MQLQCADSIARYRKFSTDYAWDQWFQKSVNIKFWQTYAQSL